MTGVAAPPSVDWDEVLVLSIGGNNKREAEEREWFCFVFLQSLLRNNWQYIGSLREMEREERETQREREGDD